MRWVKAFGKAVVLGTLAGAFPVLIVTIGIAIWSLPEGGIFGAGSIDVTLLFAIYPLIIAFPVVALAALLIGLPLLFLLRHLDAERRYIYVTSGALGGLAIVHAALSSGGNEGLGWIYFVGLACGAATAYVWWRETSLLSESIGRDVKTLSRTLH